MQTRNEIGILLFLNDFLQNPMRRISKDPGMWHWHAMLDTQLETLGRT
jgi:hypothetical protein